MTVLKLDSMGGEVRGLQLSLARLIDFGLAADGWFGPLTETAVLAYQESCCLRADGVVGEITQAAISADLAAFDLPELEDFRGRIGALVGFEGFREEPYIPRGRYFRTSGITIGYGFDIGQQTKGSMRAAWSGYLSGVELDALEQAIGCVGERAAGLLRQPVIQGIRIQRRVAARVLPRVAGGCWRAVARSLPGLTSCGVPVGVHTAALSACYQLWTDDLVPLREHVLEQDWAGFADELAAIPKDPSRRRREAGLVRRAS